MPYKEKPSVRLFYTIGEVAEMFGANASMIRYYEKEFDFIKPHKNKKGNRLFTQGDVDNFTKIFRLIRDEGLTLSQARDKMAANATVTAAATASLSAKKTPSKEIVSDRPAVSETREDQIRRRLIKVRTLLEDLNKNLDNQ
jgi:DNA-binding transcriptional MerR regulator